MIVPVWMKDFNAETQKSERGGAGRQSRNGREPANCPHSTFSPITGNRFSPPPPRWASRKASATRMTRMADRLCPSCPTRAEQEANPAHAGLPDRVAAAAASNSIWARDGERCFTSHGGSVASRDALGRDAAPPASSRAFPSRCRHPYAPGHRGRRGAPSLPGRLCRAGDQGAICDRFVTKISGLPSLSLIVPVTDTVLPSKDDSAENGRLEDKAVNVWFG